TKTVEHIRAAGAKRVREHDERKKETRPLANGRDAVTALVKVEPANASPFQDEESDSGPPGSAAAMSPLPSLTPGHWWQGPHTHPDSETRASDMLPDCVPPLGLSANLLTKRCYFRRTARNQQMQHKLMASRTGGATVRDPCISGASCSPTLRDHASRNIAPASGALPDFTEVRRR